MTIRNGDMVETDLRRSLRRHGVIVILLGALLLLGLGGWAAIAKLAAAIIAPGTVVVEGSVKKVQHLTGGIVSEVRVKEGERVQAGQLLLRLDDAAVRTSLTMVENVLVQLYARRNRLQAERIGADVLPAPALPPGLHSATAENVARQEEGYFHDRRSALRVMKQQLESRKTQLRQEIEGLTVQIKAYEQSLELARSDLKVVEALYGQRLVTLQRVTALQRERAAIEGNRGERLAARAQVEGRISETELQIVQIDEDRRSEITRELTEVEARIAENEERRAAALEQLARLEVIAPSDGRVFQLAVHTVRGVVDAGAVLMQIVPDAEQLTIDARVSIEDIDKVRPGQDVDIRFSAFDARTTPEIAGKVVSVAPDAARDPLTGAPFYAVRIRPASEGLETLGGLSLYPGMPADTFIRLTERSVISYLMKPLSDQAHFVLRHE